MGIPDYQSLMLPVLRLAEKGEVRVADAIDRLADEFALTPEERAELLPSGRQGRFANRVHWAKAFLTQAGLISTPRRGVFVANDRGRAVLAEAPERIDNTFLRQFEPFRDFLSRRATAAAETAAERSPGTNAATPLSPSETTPEELIDSAVEQLAAAVKAQLLERILTSPPALFERLVVDLLIRMGYGGANAEAGRIVGGSGDGGIDGVINEDPLGLDVVYVQAKRWALGTSVGEPEIRGFVGALLGRGATKGIFVTTSHFSPAARLYAGRLQQQRIVLIDGRELSTLLLKNGVAVRTDREILLKKVDLDYFEAAE